MGTLLQDIRFGVRMLFKNKGFTAVALITLALGIGASTAIFSLIDAVLLRPLPFPKPEQIVSFQGVNPAQGITESNISAPDFVDWQKRSDAFSQMGLFVSSNAILSSETSEPVRVPRAIAASGFFSSLGLHPFLGRFFTAEDDKEGAEPVAVLGNGLWQRRFGADLDIIGRKINVNGRTLTVVGVMPRGYAYPSETEIWTSLAFNPLEERRDNRSFEAVARLKPNVTLEQAQAQLTAINGQLSRQFHETNDGCDVTLVRLQDRLVRDVRPALLALLGAVLFVLVIACANVANLLLARASSRQREIAICAALGASRRRVVRQLVTESLLLSILGGAFGFVLSAWLIELLVRLSPLQAPRLDEIGVDYRVFAFTLFLSLGSGIFFGLVPALQATKLDLNESLNEGGRAGGASYRAGRARNLLLIGEVALSLMLLVGAGLLIKSFRHLREVHPGFNPANVLTLSITLPYARYPENAQHAAFFENLIAQVRALPGVQSAAAVLSLPLDGSDYSVGRSFILEGRPLTAAESSNASYMAATPDYFRTMQIPLLAGRDFNTQDRSNSPKVVVINQSLAQRVLWFAAKGAWETTDRLARRRFLREIVGVVGDSKGSTLDAPDQPQLFVPYAQDASWSTLSLAVRCASDPHSHGRRGARASARPR